MTEMIRTTLKPILKNRRLGEYYAEDVQPLQDLTDVTEIDLIKEFMNVDNDPIRWNQLLDDDSGLHYIWDLNDTGLSLMWADHIDNTVEGKWHWKFRLVDDQIHQTQTHRLTLCFELESDLVQIKLGPKY